MGKPNATNEEVINAAKRAMCHDFIMDFEDGYQTTVGNAGNRLSGGQKQRISIARALVKDSPIVLLDEATAFTDPENEDKIQKSINELTDGKTLVIVAHRLSTIVESDNIILIEKGEITAQGTHDTLLNTSDKYKNMWNTHIEAMDWHIQVKRGQVKWLI